MTIRDNRITDREKSLLSALVGQRVVAMISTCDSTMSDEDVIIRTDGADVRFHNTEKVPPSSLADFSKAVVSEGEIGSFRISWRNEEPKNAWDESYWSIVTIGKVVLGITLYESEFQDSDRKGDRFVDKDTTLIVFHFEDSCLVLQHRLISIMWTMSYQDSPEVDFDKLFVIEGKISKVVV